MRPPPTAKAQVTLIGAICFCCPGIYNAVTAMAGGIADPEVCPEPAAVTSLPLDCGCLKIMSILGTCCGYMYKKAAPAYTAPPLSTVSPNRIGEYGADQKIRPAGGAAPDRSRDQNADEIPPPASSLSAPTLARTPA